MDLTNYLAQAERRTYETNGSLSLVFVGILAEHKGVHTLLEALSQLSAGERRRLHLTILGKGHQQYEARLHSLVDQHQLSNVVEFQKPIPRADLPEFLGKFDALLLPSVWAEPLARIMQEGLACGMAVVGSANGGTAETIVHGENGLLFQPGDAADLAKQVLRLLGEPSLLRKLAEGGRKTAEERFDIHKMVANLEAYLMKVVENNRVH